MDLELDDEQTALVDTVRTVLAKEWPVTAARRLVEQGEGLDDLWGRFVELDWPALCVPEADGGIGYGPVEAALVLEACGGSLVGGPLLPSVALFAPLVRELGTSAQREDLLGALAAGRTTGTAALTDLTRRGAPAEVEPAALTVTARRADDCWRLDGTARSVIEAAHVDHVLVPAALEDTGGVGVFDVPVGASPAGLRVTPVRTPDGTRRLATVHLDGCALAATGLLGDGATDPRTLRRAVDETVALLAAELVGTCDTILAVTLEHVKAREQFGVPIGSFQALKHRLADAYLALEAARAAVLVAAVALAEDDARRTVAAATAKALAGDCAGLLGREGIQMLGGLGFTWEHDMHLYVKRAMASGALLGDAEAHRQRVADLIGLVPAER